MKNLGSERGHAGVTFGSTIVIVGTVLLAIGLGHDSSTLSMVGVIVLGAGTLVGINAPHIWLRRIYRRLDRVSPADPDVRTGFVIEL